MKITISRQSEYLLLLGVVSCFILSGFAALLYQTAWMRQFSLVFGTSGLAVAAVLSAYMGGLAFGASVAARYVHRITKPVLFYGLLEAGIALSALAVPWLLKLASLAYVSLLGGQPEPVDASGLGQSFFYLIIAFIVLAIPTAFMGATLPLLTKYVVQSKKQIGSRVGLLYATNTIGGIAGTLVAGFILLPAFGLNGTVYFGVGINVLVFLLAALIALHISKYSEPEASEQADTISSSAPGTDDAHFTRRLWVLPIMLLSGANSFVYEVLWTRLLGHILGGSIAAFATMLAGFLGGIAIGSVVAARLASSRERSIFWLALVQGGIAVTSMLIYQLLSGLLPESSGLSGNVGLAIAVLLPATLCIGATFPLAVRILATDAADAAPSSAKVYSWNTVGAIAGATVAAFFLIPALKYEGAIKFAVMVNTLLALGVTFLTIKQRRSFRAGALIFTAAIAIFYQPSMPEKILRASPVFAQFNGEIRYYEAGRSATVVVIEDGGFFNLRTNGLPEASTSLKGAPPSQHNQKMLSTMGVLARPEAETMLVVGMGAGVALEAVPPSVKAVDVIELEPQVIKANQFYGDERAHNPLSDPRIKVIINDARSAMTLTSKRYDAIISQPSHPWTAGASHLYTQEYMALAKEHLTTGGVYLQWMNTQFVDEFLLKSLCATMLDVYPYVRVYQWTSESLFFLGSDTPLDVEVELARTGAPLSDDPLGYLEKGIGSVEDLITALVMDQDKVEKFAVGGKIITDNNNYMATHSARAMELGTSLTRSKLYPVIKPYDPLLDENSALRTDFPVKLNYSYISRRLEGMRLKERAIDLANSLVNTRDPQALIMIGLGQHQQGELQESQKNLLLALEADPTNQQARYALLRPWFGDLLANKSLPDYVASELPNLAGTGAATLEAWLAGSKGDMQGVVKLDPQLASVLPSDLWYETSVKLRADWRIKLTNPEYQPRMVNEATFLIDSAIAFYQDFDFYRLRMQSTYLAGDTPSTFETARRFIFLIQNQTDQLEKGELSLDSVSINSLLRHTQAVIDMLNKLSGDSQIPSYKLQQLADITDDIAVRLQFITGL